jgi:clan AA aspartic protease
MILGSVTSRYEAVLRLEVRGPLGQVESVDAVIDTGFDGWLTLPRAAISRLGLAWRSRARALLADGSESIFDIHEGTVIWDGQARQASVDESDVTPLVGMGLLHGFELNLEVRRAGLVTIRALP